MKIINAIRELALRRKIRREQKLRERCVRYAKNHSCPEAALIYRFIVKGTYVYVEPGTQERSEYVYPNLEGAIHPVENPET